jgi:NAD(P)-dependent dehydrogenase (short-subunit alcohol dehydrogenase family)
VLADAVEATLVPSAAALQDAGIDAMGIVVDVSDPDAVDDLARQVINCYGAVHLVCNNAGVHPGAARCWEGAIEDWRWVLDVNLWGVLNGVRTFTPILLEQGVGHIVNTASMAGLRPYPGGATYCVSKAGVVALSEILYHELRSTGRDVGVSVLCPGATNTEGWRRAHTVGRTMAGRHEAGDDPGDNDLHLVGITEVDSPSTVAEAVVQAVVEDRFYVFPQPAMLEGVGDRFERLLAGRPPELPLIATPSAS